MKKINWNKFDNDKEALEYLKKLPRYKNNPIKSLFYRASFFFNVLKAKIFNTSCKPLLVVLVTNNGCNLKCRYCYGTYSERKEKDYTAIELLKIIDELKELGTNILLTHGGEILVRKDIDEIFNYAKHKGFYISVNINGFNVPNKINTLKQLDAICISLDGREENHDKNRGKGSYKIAVEAIDLLKKNNIPVIIHSTLTKDNTEDMEYLAQFAKDKNLRAQYSILYKSLEAETKFQEIILDDKEIRETVKKILELKHKGYPVYYSDNVLETAINWPFNYNEKTCITEKDNYKKDKNLINCYHGKLKYQIDADGRVITCWGHDYHNAPNVKELGVKKAIEECNKNDACRHCAFLANNEQNAFMDLGFKNFLNILKIQVTDALKLRK